MADYKFVDTYHSGTFEVVIKHWLDRSNNKYELQYPFVENGVKWETERMGSPSKLTFKVYKDPNGYLNFQEGDMCMLIYKEHNSNNPVELFTGFIFVKKRNKDGWINVTAYDQLRYLKNKGTYVYTNKTASDVLKMIAKDYKLNLGTIDNTNYVIGSRTEDNQSLFDIIQNALDLTAASTGKIYVLYSDKNKLYLRQQENLRTNVVINDYVAENFDYSSSIDQEVYNDIELYYDDDESNKRIYYHATDTKTMADWGRLRYTESIQNPANGQSRADQMLKNHNRKYRTLSVKGAFGDWQCRAGASVVVNLGLGDINVNNYMLIEKATHTFKKDEYRMDLTLSDKEIGV